MIWRIVDHCRNQGLRGTARRGLSKLIHGDAYARAVKKHGGEDLPGIFTTIYQENFWGSPESRSGEGSTLANTASIRSGLERFIAEWNIKSMVDAPCGDFNWMKELVLPDDFRYTGIDIAQQVIASNNINYASQRRNFICGDLTADPIPAAELVFCRDCLFHLSYKHIYKFIDRFLESGAQFLMTSTHKNKSAFLNVDILSGGFRKIDLFSTPFLFDRDVLFRVDDFVAPFPEREMCVWSRAQIRAAAGARASS
jgi:hypothetical protein